MKPRIIRGADSNEHFFKEGCFIQELSNSLDDSYCSIARARVEPGVTTRLHRLSGIVERYVILEGRGRTEVGEAPPADVGPGDVVLIPAGCEQRITNTGESDLIFLAICTPRFRPNAYEDVDESQNG